MSRNEEANRGITWKSYANAEYSRLVHQGREPVHSGERHRDPVIVLGAGPRCQVLRFIQAWCHKRLRAVEETRLTEPPQLAAVPEGATGFTT